MDDLQLLSKTLWLAFRLRSFGQLVREVPLSDLRSRELDPKEFVLPVAYVGREAVVEVYLLFLYERYVADTIPSFGETVQASKNVDV